MAAQLYSETQIAECLYEVLEEFVADGSIEEPLALATLNQVTRCCCCWLSLLSAPYVFT